jgi:hypothetical protein
MLSATPWRLKRGKTMGELKRREKWMRERIAKGHRVTITPQGFSCSCSLSCNGGATSESEWAARAYAHQFDAHHTDAELTYLLNTIQRRRAATQEGDG